MAENWFQPIAMYGVSTLHAFLIRGECFSSEIESLPHVGAHKRFNDLTAVVPLTYNRHVPLTL